MPRNKKQLSGRLSAWGPRWAQLDGLEFVYNFSGKAPTGWRIVNPASGTFYDSEAYRIADAVFATAQIIPQPFRKILSLSSRANFVGNGQWPIVDSKRLPDGKTLYSYERVGRTLQLTVDEDDFVLEAVAITADQTNVISSGFRVSVEPTERLHLA